MRAAAWLVLAACAAGVAGAPDARRVRRANDDDDDDGFSLIPTVNRNKPCTTSTGLEGICVHESMCDESDAFHSSAIFDDSEIRWNKCPGRLDWCCSVMNSNVTGIVASTESSEQTKPAARDS